MGSLTLLSLGIRKLLHDFRLVIPNTTRGAQEGVPLRVGSRQRVPAVRKVPSKVQDPSCQESCHSYPGGKFAGSFEVCHLWFFGSSSCLSITSFLVACWFANHSVKPLIARQCLSLYKVFLCIAAFVMFKSLTFSLSLLVCVYVRVCVYVCICVCMRVLMGANFYMCVHVHVNVPVCLSVCPKTSHNALCISIEHHFAWFESNGFKALCFVIGRPGQNDVSFVWFFWLSCHCLCFNETACPFQQGRSFRFMSSADCSCHGWQLVDMFMQRGIVLRNPQEVPCLSLCL